MPSKAYLEVLWEGGARKRKNPRYRELESTVQVRYHSFVSQNEKNRPTIPRNFTNGPEINSEGFPPKYGKHLTSSPSRYRKVHHFRPRLLHPSPQGQKRKQHRYHNYILPSKTVSQLNVRLKQRLEKNRLIDHETGEGEDMLIRVVTARKR